MDLNKVMLIGRLGDKPHKDDDTGRVRISLATSYKPKDGEPKTDWHDITLWGRQAEIAEEFFCKGMLIYAECRLNYWKRKVGEKEYKAPSLTGSHVIMLSRPQAEPVAPKPENDDLPF